MLSDKILVVEVSKDSGLLYTVGCRIKYKKEVFAVHGNIDSKNSMDTNLLIKEGIKPYLSCDDRGLN